MNTMTVRTPWHLWVVGVISLLWNAFGFYNFIMSATQGEAYYRSMGVAQTMIDYVAASPSWTWAAWAIGTAGAVLGSLLLLLRRKLALPAFIVSFVGAAVLNGYQKFIDPYPGAMADPISWTVLVVALFLIGYAWAMSAKGVLR